MNSDNEEMSRISGILSKIPKRVTPEDRIAELEAEVTRLAGELAEARKLCKRAEIVIDKLDDGSDGGENLVGLVDALRSEAEKGGGE